MKRLEKEQPSPIEKLESWINRPDFVDRQVGFCAQWALDNLCKLVIFFKPQFIFCSVLDLFEFSNAIFAVIGIARLILEQIM